MKTKRVCVKVSELRYYYGQDITFEKWLNNPDNVYVGRRGRIFIDKKIFHYSGSKWENPFTVKEYGLDECIKRYDEYIRKKIEDNPTVYNVDELSGKNLGCFCDPRSRCHADILIEILKQ